MEFWMKWHLGLDPTLDCGQTFSQCLNSSTLFSSKQNISKNLHVGVLGGGDLGAVGQVDVSLLGKRPVDVFVVDVLDHRLEMDKFYIFNK